MNALNAPKIVIVHGQNNWNMPDAANALEIMIIHVATQYVFSICLSPQLRTVVFFNLRIQHEYISNSIENVTAFAQYARTTSIRHSTVSRTHQTHRRTK